MTTTKGIMLMISSYIKN